MGAGVEQECKHLSCGYLDLHSSAPLHRDGWGFSVILCCLLRRLYGCMLYRMTMLGPKINIVQCTRGYF